jgi:threonine dehydratase
MMDSTRSTDFPTLFLFCFVSSEKVGFGHNTTMASTTAYMPATETMTTGQSPVDTSTTADMPAAKTMTAVHSEAPPDFVVSIPPVSVKPIKKVKYKYITRRQANALVIDSGEAVAKALHGLEPARRLAEQAGLTVDSSILGNETSAVDSHLNVVLMTTGGFSNRDHLVEITGDPRTDRISELKRNLQRRARSMKPEDRAENK